MSTPSKTTKTRTRYVLVEREGYHPTAVSPAVLADMLLRAANGTGDAVLSQRPITKKEIRTERVRTEEDAHYFEQVGREDFSRKWHGWEGEATVLWFDRSKGVGRLRIAYKEGHFTVSIYACNIEGRKTWFAETAAVYYEEGQTVRVRLDTPAYGTVSAAGLTPGHLDTDKWDRIKDTNLAFRCDDEGRAVNGLFG